MLDLIFLRGSSFSLSFYQGLHASFRYGVKVIFFSFFEKRRVTMMDALLLLHLI